MPKPLTAPQHMMALADPARPWRTGAPTEVNYYERFLSVGNRATLTVELWNGRAWRVRSWPHEATGSDESAPWRARK